jgi:hypothetical protein
MILIPLVSEKVVFLLLCEQLSDQRLNHFLMIAFSNPLLVILLAVYNQKEIVKRLGQ